MGISMYEASVGVFIPFLDNLSGLLDHADAYADSRNIDSAILLGMRLHPGMYNLAQQVGEANRHAVIACALLSGHVPLTVPTAEPDLAELKRRITAACEFLRGLPRGGRSTPPVKSRSSSDFAAVRRQPSADAHCF